jgi:sulfhydrogenase subunit delta
MNKLLQSATRPRIAVFELASCAGCQLQILNCEDELVDLLGLVDFVYFKEARSDTSDEYDIALIEGTVTRPADEPKLRTIRDRAKVVATLGACAYPGGIPALRNAHVLADLQHTVYGEHADYFPTGAARPVDAVIPVDLHILGCPIDKDEFIRIVTAVLIGKKPDIPGYPVCVECKLRENVCAFDRDEICLGPVTRAGCGARCPSYGSHCFGCRGLADDPNTTAMEGILERHGLSVQDVLAQYALYNGGITEEPGRVAEEVTP